MMTRTKSEKHQYTVSFTGKFVGMLTTISYALLLGNDQDYYDNYLRYLGISETDHN
jgi:hypothetical protein